MKKVLRHFRGLRAVVLQGEVTGRDTLLQTLKKLGLEAEAMAPETVSAAAIATADVIFFDADEGLGRVFGDGALPNVPIIAIVGSEAPSRLTRVVKVRATSHILKPVRSSGIFTALLLGINEHAERNRISEETVAIRGRLAGRRTVLKAVIALMRRWGIDEDTAYKKLRSDAMHERIPVEEAAACVLAASPDYPPNRRRAGSWD